MIGPHPELCALAALMWVIAAVTAARLRGDRRGRALWALVVAGVPMLGWLTLAWGPVAGLAGFVAGGAILARPLQRLNDT
mgnify:FL=1